MVDIPVSETIVEVFVRRCVITIENCVIGDGLFSKERANVLRAIADAIDAGQAGDNSNEIFHSDGGSTATIRCEAISYPCIPYRTHVGPMFEIGQRDLES